MNIYNHPIWNQVTPYQTKIPLIKKPIHLLRIYLARQYARWFSRDTFIGVTGSLGKTTCTQLCAAVLSQKYKTIATTPNLDPILNIPTTLLKMNPRVKKAVLEMGVEYKGEMDFYLSVVRPKTVIFTKLAFAHSEFLGNLDEILQEKGKLIEQLPEDGVAILNWDDPGSKKLAQRCKGTVIYYGTDPKNCTVWAGNVNLEDFRTTFELNLGVERVKVNFQLLGFHQIYPALAAAALGVLYDIPLTKIKLALESIQPSEHRMQPMAGPNGSIIIDDTYNSSPAAVEAAIDTLLQIPARRRVVVLGEMRELGEYSEKLHREVAQKIYKEKIDMVFLGQGEAEIIAAELRDLGFWEERVEANLQIGQLVGKLLKTLGKGDVCLIKGSRAVRLDEVVKRVSKVKNS
ncbi:UDP-N-acetylmuramoyl-tripeptide--D-alanyl-D-alanine ligase [Candidatus Daviesbacteria bacterium]|nr:UDP-N-acetylmuramoyl-tripeptide--D-alanyl-D-alanine ligase [Candidatus Daviesbacteria bacterium]